MISESNESKPPQVIPRWMGYWQSIDTGELGLPDELSNPILSQRLGNGVSEFLKFPSARLGGELLEKCFLLGVPIDPRLSDYVLRQKTLSGVIRKIAESRLAGLVKPSDDYKTLVALHRKALKDNPRNGIRWVELARLHLILGDKAKAERALRIALSLNPRDRYTVRSAIRFYFHVEDEDGAVSVLGKDLIGYQDPWLKSVGLSALLWSDRRPIRKLALPINGVPASQLFDNSEYIEALGMLELTRDSHGAAKKLFKTAWENPSGNVTTHAEWVTRKIFPGLRDQAMGSSRNTPEANARLYFSQRRWRDAFCAANEWMLEEPYSRRPYRFLVNMNNTLMRFEDALNVAYKSSDMGPLDLKLKVGKLYALLCLSRLDEAEAELRGMVIDNLKDYDKPVFFADVGMLNYLKKNYKEGEDNYLAAERTAAKESNEYRERVFLNHMVARKMAGLVITDDEKRRLLEKNPVSEQSIDTEILMWRVNNGSDKPIELPDKSHSVGKLIL